VKGNVYLGTQSFFDRKVPGGLATLVRAIPEPELRDFIQQKFLAVSWYDVLPAVPLIRAEARAMGFTVRRYLTIRSTYQAERDLTGVYRFLLKVTSTESVALRLPRLFAQIFDFGTAESTVVAPGHVRAFVRDFPTTLFDWFAVSIEAYATTAMRLTGANDPHAHSRRIDAALAPDGTQLSSLRIDLRWSP
jgi:hypothetical protein